MRWLFALFVVVVVAACVPKHHQIVEGSGVGLGPAIGMLEDGPFRLVFAGPKGETREDDADHSRRASPPSTPTDITLAFSRSVTAESARDGGEGGGEAVIPATIVRDADGTRIEGVWHWFGEGAAVFHPTKPFAFATTYRVEPRPIVARDRSTLDAASLTPFTFTTARPKLERVDYEYEGTKDVHLLRVRFNQPVSARAAKESLRIQGRGPTLAPASAGIGTDIAFRVVENESHNRDDHTLVTLEVNVAIARLEDVVLIASTSLRSEDGPVGPLTETRLPIEGVGPFKVELSCTLPNTHEATKIKEPAKAGKPTLCDRFGSSIDLRLTKDVKVKDLLRHLVIAPPAKADPDVVKELRDQETMTTLDLSSLLSVEPGKTYRVTLTAGLLASDKDRLTSDQVFEFQTIDSPPDISFRDLSGRETIIESARTAIPLHVSVTNVPSFDVIQAPMDEKQLTDLLFVREEPEDATAVSAARGAVSDRPAGRVITAGRNAAWARALPKSVTTTIAPTAAKNASSSVKIDFAPERAIGSAGMYVLATHSNASANANAANASTSNLTAPLEDDLRVLSVTDLGVTTKWSPHGGGLVWVTRLSTTEPVANATVSLRRVWPAKRSDAQAHASSSEAFRTTTDREGIAIIPPQVAATFLRAAPEATDDLKSRTSAEPFLIIRNESDWTYARLPELDPSLLPSIGYMFVERGLYRPGETAFVKGYVRSPSARGLMTRTLAGKTVVIEALDADHRVFHAATGTVDAFGAFSCEIPIPKTARLGHASVRARVGLAPPPRPLRRSRYVARWGSEEMWIASDHFKIDEFRTPELKVESTTDRKSYMRGEKATLSTTGTYLLGAPVTNVPVTVDVSHVPTAFTPPGLERFSTNTSLLDESVRTSGARTGAESAHLDAKLDNAGHASFAFPFPAATSTSPDAYTFDVSVQDVSRAFAYGDSVSVLVHPSDVYLGVRTGDDHENGPIIAGKTVQANLVAAAIDGTRQAGIKTRVDVYRALKKGTKPSATGVGCTLTTDAAKVVSCTLSVVDEGQHWLKATALDTHGRAIAAATSFYVAPKNTKPPPPPPPPAPPPKPTQPALTFEQACAEPSPTRDGAYVQTLAIDSKPNRSRFVVGETALMCVRSVALNVKAITKASANAANTNGATATAIPAVTKTRVLLTTEREGILRRDPLIELTGPTGTIAKLPITEDLHPNATAVAVEAIGRTAPFPPPNSRVGDSGYPRTTSESGHISIEAPGKKLTVAIEPPKTDVRPGSDIELRLNVKDGDGRAAPSQITVWAIDEGIHLLVPRSVPKPEDTFGEERRSDVVGDDTRSHIFFERGSLFGAHRTKAPSLRQGATGVSPRNLIGRSVFRPTAFFVSNVVTDANGSAMVRAKLPDNLTTWKVFAVAATAADAFGSGEASFKANKPLMVRPQLPRFLRTGDRFDATVVIDSLVKEPLDAVVTMNVAGVLGFSSSSSSSSSGAVPAKQTMTIPAEGHVPIRFPIEARAVGTGKVTFKVVTTKTPTAKTNATPPSELFDEVTIDEDVQSIASIETVTLAGEIPAAPTPMLANEHFGDLRKARPDIGGFDVRLSTTPLVGLAESIKDLIEYPYGCTEQLSSRLVPLVRLRGMARDFGVTMPPNVDGAVRSSLATLLSHQRDDGGFGFWRGSRKSEAWLTLLALDALHTSERAGYAVPATAIERARAWLEKPTTESDPQKQGTAAASAATKQPLDPESRAMLEDLLTSLGRSRESELRALAAMPMPALSLFGQALVAHALAKAGHRDLAAQVLDRILAQAQKTSGMGALITFADEPGLSPRAHLSSNARTTAMALRAMLAVDPKHPLATKTVRGLLSMRHQGRWPTTQASAWALAALEDARALYTPKAGHTTAELRFDGKTIAKTSFLGTPGGETRTESIAMSRLLAAPGAALSFDSDGERPLYYEGTLRYARAEPPTSPLDHGISIARSLRPLATASPSSSSLPSTVAKEGNAFRIGDYVVVDVVIASSVARDLVVIDDPIPAGFEAVNQTFSNVDRAALIVVDPTRELTHRELHDDRVVSFFDALPAGAHITRYALRAIASGRFALPPAKAECMYSPDIFGRTATTWIETR